ncbi:hypothetical protein I79_021291 [Cricetulus griseus]|uniref:Uncharacterized protein n=1 Tax=Cricetulus griseus TaxID=10029 RepID=G3ICA0_CRIGR|nr:hypothetical protein I79_021291 [Cricetulus griseus]
MTSHLTQQCNILASELVPTFLSLVTALNFCHCTLKGRLGHLLAPVEVTLLMFGNTF